jgi:hypothetical protein
MGAVIHINPYCSDCSTVWIEYFSNSIVHKLQTY